VPPASQKIISQKRVFFQPPQPLLELPAGLGRGATPCDFYPHDAIKCYHAYMIRSQIQLREGQVQALKDLSQKTGLSVAALIRQAADMLIEEGARGRGLRSALQVAGKYSSSASDVAADHDRYLDEAWGH